MTQLKIDAEKYRWIMPVFFFCFTIAWYWRTLGLYFEGDDWSLVGPGAAANFLGNPFGIFSQTHGFHYQPFTMLIYGISSVLFQGNPFPYHMLSLFLFGLMMLLYCLLLRRLNLSPLSQAAALVVFGFSWAQLNIIHWIAAVSYITLAGFIFVSLIHWDRFLEKNNRLDLLIVIGTSGLGLMTHSLGVLLPVILFLYFLFLSQGKQKNWEIVIGFLSMSLFLSLAVQVLPQYLFSEGDFHLWLGTDAMAVARKLLFALKSGILTSLFGSAVSGFGPITRLGTLLSIALPILLALFLVLWMIKRTRANLLIFGFLLVVIFWLPEVVYDQRLLTATGLPARYHFFPFLGLSLMLAALFSAVEKVINGRWRLQLIIGSSMFLFAFLMNNHIIMKGYLTIITSQQEFVRTTAGKFLSNLSLLVNDRRLTSCGKITILDVPLNESRPIDMKYGFSLYHANHENFFRFFNLEKAGKPVEFIKYGLGGDTPRADCVFIAHNGKLLRLPGKSGKGALPAE